MDRIDIGQYRALIAAGNIPTVKKKRSSPEEDLHRTCIELVVLSTARYPLLRWMIHVPNGGKRPRGEAGKLKALGTKPGYPDLTLPRRHHHWSGLAIELKSSIGKLTRDQREWLDAFEEDGWLVSVCRTLEEFESTLKRYLEGK
jgi:hypothetical protein